MMSLPFAFSADASMKNEGLSVDMEERWSEERLEVGWRDEFVWKTLALYTGCYQSG